MAGEVTVATLVAKLEADTRDFQRQMKSVDRRLNDLEGSSKKAGKGVDQFGKLLRAAAAAGAAKAAADLFKLGVQVEAWGRRYETVFGEATSVLDQWVGEQNERFGVAEERLKGMAAQVGDLLVPMGFARTEAANMSKEVLTLANALSEWTGGARSAEETTDILTKALLGEREALKGLGVSLTDAEIQAELTTRGMQGLTGEALAQAKAMISLELITGKSADAMAAYEDGAGGAMQAQKRLEAAMDDLRVAAGEFLTALAPAVEFLAKTIQSVIWWIETLTDQFDGNIEQVEEWKKADAAKAFEEWATSIGHADRALGRSRIVQFLEGFLNIADEFGASTSQAAGPVRSFFEEINDVSGITLNHGLRREWHEATQAALKDQAALNAAKAEAEKFWKEIAETAGKAFADEFKKDKDVKKAVDAFLQSIADQKELARLFGEMGAVIPQEVLAGMVSGMDPGAAVEMLKALLDNPEELWRLAAGAGSGIPGAVVSGALANIGIFASAGDIMGLAMANQANLAFASAFNPQPGRPPPATSFAALNVATAAALRASGVGGFRGLPKLHSGGVVPGSPGAEVPAMLKAGETVLPTHKTGGMGGGITINVYGDVTGEEIIERVRRGLRQETIRGGSLEFA